MKRNFSGVLLLGGLTLTSVIALPLTSPLTSAVWAQTDDDPAPTSAVTRASDSALEKALDSAMATTLKRDLELWDDLDINDDDSLDGIELNRGMGGWIAYDGDGNGEVSKSEWMEGSIRDVIRSLKSTPFKTVPPQKLRKYPPMWMRAVTTPVTTPVATPATRPAAPVSAPKVAKAPQRAPRAKAKPVALLSPVNRRAGYIVGRAVRPDGSAVPSFTVDYSGFEDGKLANSYMNGSLIETINTSTKGSGGRYAAKVPPGAYRASAYASYNYRGRLYHFEMESLGPTPNYDFKSLELEKLRSGLVRDFVLKMTGKRKGASETSESVYRTAYFGGTINLDAGQYEGQIGGGARFSTPLRNAFPPESTILLSLSPSGPRVDGTAGETIEAQFPLGDDGKWTFMVRGVYPGLYGASAQLRLPDGQIKPLRLSTKATETVSNPGGYDRLVFNRQSSVSIDFLPKTIGPAPRMGVDAVTLYLGE